MLANFETGLKICSRCKKEQPISQYTFNRTATDKFSCYCKSCCKANAVEYKKNNPEKIRAANDKWSKKSGYQSRRYKEKISGPAAAARQATVEKHIKFVKGLYGDTVTAMGIGRKASEFVIVDEADVEKILNFIGKRMLTKHETKNRKYKAVKIQIQSTKSKKRKPKNTAIMLHSILTNSINSKKVVNHINGDAFDCRQCNLQASSFSDNNHLKNTYSNNKSGYPGVNEKSAYPGVRNNLPKKIRYKAFISNLGKQIYLGTFDTFEDAKIAKQAAEIKYWGEFAPKRAEE